MSTAAPPPRTAADAARTPREAFRVFARHGSPRVLTAALAVAALARGIAGDVSALDLVPLAALAVLWPLQEWLIHVFVLHYRPRRVLGRELDFRVPHDHRAHHRDPWNPELIFIPLHSFLYSLPLLVGLWFAVMPDAPRALTGIAAHLAGALHYEWVHLLVHTRVQPRTRFYRRLWRNHRLHHFKNEHYWFGVTRLGADRVLGTSPDPERVPASPTARTLGVAPADAPG